jgi:hypothetical protein
MKSNIDLWANFLANEKMTPKSVGEADTLKLIDLCKKMAETRGPIIRPYAKKLESRRFVCMTAMDMGIDLPAMNRIGRGLLDAWNLSYKERHGTNYGTAAIKEAKRRDIVTKLSKRDKNDV